MAKKVETTKNIAKPKENPPGPGNCPQGYVWNPDIKKCVPNVG